MTERTCERGGRLDAVICRLWPEHSRSVAVRAIKAGGVRVEGTIVTKPSTSITPGARLELEVPEPIPTRAQAQDLPVAIVYQDADVAVIDKAAGMVVHPGAGNHDGTLVNALLHHLDDLSGIGGELRPGIVHRLDKGTSGLLVVAKNDRAHQHLAAQFADHSAGRTYLALCAGRPRQPHGTIESQLGRHPKHRVRFASVEQGRRAITHWEVLEELGTITAIRCKLATGRTHQIRVHLTEAGWPLLGDPLYGKARAPASIRGMVAPDRPLLHAKELAFVHPDGRDLRFEAPLPPDMRRILDALRGTP